MAKKPATAEAPTKTSEVPIEQAILSANFVPIEKLIPYAQNARTHSDAQVAQLAGLIVEFGWTNPVLADEKGIVAGHGRIMAARQLYDAGKVIKLPNGLEIPAGTVPVLDCTGWSDTKRRAYILADNQSALNSGWDAELLKLEIAAIQASDFDFDLIGFDKDFMTDLLGTNVHFGKTDPDAVPEPPANPVSRAGDIWVLGEHRVICGDSTVAENVTALLAGAKPHLLVSDPPYGVEYDADWRNKRVRADGSPSDGRAIGKVENDDRADWRDAWALFPGDAAYVWCASLHVHEVAASLHVHEVAASLHVHDFVLRSQIIWVKQQFAIGRGDYHWKHEPCWYAVRDGKTGHWNGDRKQTTVWEIDKPQKSETGHSTQKPIECMRRPIENNSKIGDRVYDPFLGSGTTLIAAEMMGRVCLGCELNPAYVDVIVTRWEQFTGKAAVLEGSVQTFAEVLAERCPAGQIKAVVEGKPEKKKRGAAAAR